MPTGRDGKGFFYGNGARLGDVVGGNYMEVEANGTIKLYGTAIFDDQSTTVDVFKSIKIGGTSNYTTIGTAGQIAMVGTVAKGIDLQIFTAAASASGLLIGSGTSLLPATTAVANAKFVELRCQTTATSDDNRLAYLRYDIAGTTGGECIRAMTKVSAATTTVRGAHISLDLAAAGTVSGLGVGVDAQLMFAAATTYSAGTLAVVNAEMYTGATSVVTAPSSFFRANNGGSAKATVDDNAVLLDLSGFTSGAAKLWYDNQGTAPANVEEWIKIRTPSGVRWLAAYNAVV